MCPKDIAILAIFNEKHKFDLNQLKRATDINSREHNYMQRIASTGLS